MKVTVTCPVTGRPVRMNVKEATTEAEARSRAKFRLKKWAEDLDEATRNQIVQSFKAIEAANEAKQLAIADKVLRDLHNGTFNPNDLKKL